MADVKLNLYQKISEITNAIGTIKKDSNAPKEMGGYSFTSHGAVLANLRHELTARNVVIHPSGEELLHHEAFEKRTITEYQGKTSEKVSYNFHSIIKYKFTVVDGDNPSDFFEDYWIGEGMDTQDKGIQKSGTSAEKYYLMKLFKIGDKDDPDGIDANTGSTGTTSESATINKPSTANIAPAPALKPTEVMQQQLATNGNAAANAEIDPKKQLENLFWLGEELSKVNPKSGWFRGKISALISAYDSKKKNNNLTPEESAAGNGLNSVYAQLVKAHIENCGADCEHVKVVELAMRVGGTVSEKA